MHVRFNDSLSSLDINGEFPFSFFTFLITVEFSNSEDFALTTFLKTGNVSNRVQFET